MPLRRPATEPRKGDDPKEMSFLEHLEELRRTFIRMALVTLVSMLVCFAFTPSLLNILLRPVQGIWLAHEREHLPASVRAEDWLLAKELQQVRTGVSEPLRRELETRMSPQVLQLADALELLRATALLPPTEQETFLARADPPQVVELARELRRAGADLHIGQGKFEPRIMGAFRPGEAFLLSVQLAFFGGVVLASPLLLYLLLRFVMPGLLAHEKRVLLRCLWWGVLLFLVGCAFSYWAVLPRVLSFFHEYSLSLGIANEWRIGYYLSFAIKLVLVFGVIFELPVVLYPLMRFNILTRRRMRRIRPYMLVGSFALALLLAPAPDPGTMLLMALPLYLLYELCIFFAHDPNESKKPS